MTINLDLEKKTEDIRQQTDNFAGLQQSVRHSKSWNPVLKTQKFVFLLRYCRKTFVFVS